MTLVPSQCPICKAHSAHLTGRNHQDSGTNYTQYHCTSCTIEFWWPLKNPGPDWYRKAEQYGERNDDPVWDATSNHKKTLSLLDGKGKSVLDVGCGIGNFLLAAEGRGWRTAGIDFDPDAIEAAKKVTHNTAYEVSDIVAYAKLHDREKFDLVTFFDVLEHVDNHNEFIGAITSLLTPSGYVAMSMPYRHHARWLMKADLPPRHLTCWDRTSLRKFLEARGFDVVYMRRSSEGIWPIVMKLRFKYGKYFSFGAVSVARKVAAESGSITTGTKRPLLVRLVHFVAKAKDIVLFGLPALIIFIAMLPTSKRYVDLFAIARKRF